MFWHGDYYDRRAQATLMNLKIAQVMGLNTDQKAAQVASNTREDTTFLAVLILSSDDAFTKGRQALSELSDFFFDSDGNQAQKLNAAFAEAKNKFPEGNFDLCLGSICGKVLYLLGQGEVEVYLGRNDKISSLLSVASDGQLISGFIEPGDKLLLMTKNLTDFLGDELEKSFKLPLEGFKEEIESKIGATQSENDGLAALALEASEEEVQPASEGEEVQAPVLNEQVLNEELAPKKRINYRKLAQAAATIFNLAREYFPKSGRGRLILGIILMIFVSGGIAYKYITGKENEKNAQFNQIMQQAKDNLASAKSMATLNSLDAKAKLDQALIEADKALALKPKSQDAQNLKKEIENESPSILKESSISDFPEFLDMDLVKKNFRAEKMSLSAGKLLLLDPNVKTLATVDLSKKSNQVLAGSEQLGEAVMASLNGASAFVYSKDKGIVKVEGAKSKTTVVSKADDELGKIIDIYGFAGNVYLLEANKIWKYLPTSEGYSDKREYLSRGGSATKNQTADFSSAQRMQIESSIYVLKESGEILRFTKGDKDNFSYSGLPTGVKDPKSFFTSSDTENLYILDSGNSRLLTLTKTGAYKGQMTGSKFATASDLVVDEISKKVYLLEGSKIYSIDLK